jgi:hypothetical protein
MRVAINPDTHLLDGGNLEEILLKAIEDSIVETGVKILIVDNITYLRADNERAKDALPLMKRLKALKEKYNLSILALAHTPKRSLEKEITNNDLAGSKMLINFCDSAFSIGKSAKDENVRYIKQMKERNTGKIYGSENVCVCEVSKPNNFLSFEFLGFGDEKEHLRAKTHKDKELLIQEVVDLKAQSKSHQEIATILGIGKGSVTNYLNEAKKLGISPISTVQDVQTVHPLFEMNGMNTVNDSGDMGCEL